MAKIMKTMRDSNGNDIPLKYVSAYDKARDKAVRRIHARFVKARQMLEALTAESIKELQDLSQLKENLGEKGNFTASTFDGLVRVSIRQRYDIRLDERVIKARELMLEYIDTVLSRVGTDDAKALRTIVFEAFRANSAGYLSTGRILALMRMEINDQKWIEAKLMLQESLKPQKGKQYLSCETRRDMQHDFQLLRLDIADCWPKFETSGAANE